MIGFASGRIPQLPVNLTLLKGAAVLGVFWGAFTQHQPQENQANYRKLFAWHAEGKLRPLVSQCYALASAGDALEALRMRKAVGKLVVKIR